MQTPNYPICEATYVNCDVLVDLVTPGRNELAIFVEAVNRLLAELADKVDSGLEVELLLEHNDTDHVMCVPF